jgi:hypothetical protein
MKEHGLKKMLNHKAMIGLTDVETVKLDFDETTFQTVKYWALRALKHFQLEGFIIFKSSQNCYHVIFNRSVSWSENMHIMAWVSLLSHNESLLEWLRMQCIKEASTLRVSPKHDKPSPRLVFRYGIEDKQIKEFLHYRNFVKKMMQNMKNVEIE